MVDDELTGTNGAQLIRDIHERPALGTLGIVLLTSSVADGHAAAQAGVAHHLIKPPGQSQLYNMIAKAISPPTLQAHPVSVADLSSPGTRNCDALPVLVAEDDPVNQLVARALLEKRGLSVHLARNGREAVRMSAEHDYSAIFMDCHMPELDGYQATASIRAREAEHHTPIIATTANATSGDGDRCLAAGMDDHLPKPIQGDRLDQILELWVTDP